MLGKYKTASLLVIIVLVGAAAAMAVPSQVNKLGLSRDGSFTVLTIQGSDQLRYAHQSVEAREGKPFRIVVDCLAARHGLPQKEYDDLPRSIISSIRTSQYSVAPEEVVRVVLDLNEESVYRVEADGNSIKVLISDPKTAPFAQWTGGKVTTPSPKPAPVAAKDKPIAKAPATQKTVEAKPLATATGEKPQPAVPSVKRKPSVVKQKEQSETTLAEKPSNVYRLPSQNKNTVYGPVAMAAPPIPQKQLATKNNVKPATESTPAKPTTVASATSTQPQTKTAPTVTSDPKKPATAVASKTEKSQTQPAEKSKPVMAQTTTPATPKQLVNNNQTTVKKDLAKDSIAKAKVFAALEPAQSQVPEPGMNTEKNATGQKDVHKTTPAQPTEKKAPDSKQATPSQTATAPTPVKADDNPVLASVDKADQKPAAPDAAKDENVNKIRTSKYRRESAKSAEMKASQVVQFPQRMVIKYKQVNARDPFESLVTLDKKRQGNVDLNRVPNVETLNLVGILEPEAGKGAALMEDLDGIGYILRPGDRVRNGYVAQIDKNAIYFQINEYGWGRTLVKHMEKEN